MGRKAFRKIFLTVVIFLFSVFALGQSTWACDDDDGEPTGECYKQLDIKWVDLDLYYIYILGQNFDNGDPPKVTLGGIQLDVYYDLWTATWIVAALPQDIVPGQYRLRVSTGDGRKCKDKYSVKIHPAPPKPPCEEPPKCECPPEACTYTCPQPTCTCPQATFTSTTITSDHVVDVPTIVTAPDPVNGWRPLFEATTPAPGCPSGTKVTGGGFEVLLTPTLTPTPPSLNILTSVFILASRPSDSGTGWFVRGLINPSSEFTAVDNFTLRIHAVCGTVEQKVDP
jgi:hypothetical protein